MTTTKRILVLAVVLAIPLWVTAIASGAKPDCSIDPTHPSCKPGDTTTTTAPKEGPENCAKLEWGDPLDGDLVMSATDSPDCNDIRNEDSETTFRFDFVTQPPGEVIKTIFVLGIRNSVPGDWCGGLWKYYDDKDNLLGSGEGNALRPRNVGDGWYATLELNEEITAVGSNCTTDGEVRWADNDPGWVITLDDGGGRPLRGSQAITVTWQPWNLP